MKASRSFGQAAAFLLYLSPFASASWGLPDLDALVVRQNSDGSNTAAKPTAAPQSTGSSNAANTANTFNLNTGAVATSSGSASGSASGTASSSGSGTTGGGNGSKGNSTKTSSGPKHSMFPPTDPAGSVVMVTPAATAPTQLYKIGDKLTFGWNYTYLLGPPTAIDVLASCSVATRTYTLTQNMTFATHGSYTWDTQAFQAEDSVKASPLLVDQYTLVIKDSENAVTATADPGYLGTFEGFTFGMYTPQPYTPLASGWTCASCSAGVSDMDRRALGFAMTMCVVTVLSFTWFVTGLRVAL